MNDPRPFGTPQSIWMTGLTMREKLITEIAAAVAPNEMGKSPHYVAESIVSLADAIVEAMGKREEAKP